LGLALITLGFFAIGGAVGIVVGIVGFAPLAAGVFDFCSVGGYVDGRKNLEGRLPGTRRGGRPSTETV
jgi:hypothetical protein